jgi:hypothetical protein
LDSAHLCRGQEFWSVAAGDSHPTLELFEQAYREVLNDTQRP